MLIVASRNARSEDTVLYSLKDKQETPHETKVTFYSRKSTADHLLKMTLTRKKNLLSFTFELHVNKKESSKLHNYKHIFEIQDS